MKIQHNNRVETLLIEREDHNKSQCGPGTIEYSRHRLALLQSVKKACEYLNGLSSNELSSLLQIAEEIEELDYSRFERGLSHKMETAISWLKRKVKATFFNNNVVEHNHAPLSALFESIYNANAVQIEEIGNALRKWGLPFCPDRQLVSDLHHKRPFISTSTKTTVGSDTLVYYFEFLRSDNPAKYVPAQMFVTLQKGVDIIDSEINKFGLTSFYQSLRSGRVQEDLRDNNQSKEVRELLGVMRTLLHSPNHDVKSLALKLAQKYLNHQEPLRVLPEIGLAIKAMYAKAHLYLSAYKTPNITPIELHSILSGNSVEVRDTNTITKGWYKIGAASDSRKVNKIVRIQGSDSIEIPLLLFSNAVTSFIDDEDKSLEQLRLGNIVEAFITIDDLRSKCELQIDAQNRSLRIGTVSNPMNLASANAAPAVNSGTSYDEPSYLRARVVPIESHSQKEKHYNFFILNFRRTRAPKSKNEKYGKRKRHSGGGGDLNRRGDH